MLSEQSNGSGLSPHSSTMMHAAAIALKQDRPIMMDYYEASCTNAARLVQTQDKDTILYKNSEEYTSPLNKVFQIDDSKSETGKDIICLSENSIYIIHSNILANKGTA